MAALEDSVDADEFVAMYSFSLVKAMSCFSSYGLRETSAALLAVSVPASAFEVAPAIMELDAEVKCSSGAFAGAGASYRSIENKLALDQLVDCGTSSGDGALGRRDTRPDGIAVIPVDLIPLVRHGG